MTELHAWTTDSDYLGVAGADSLDDMARAITAPDTYVFGYDQVPTDDYDACRAWLDTVTVVPVKVPAALLRTDRWDGSHIHKLASLDERPGRGYAKVLGVFL